MGQIWKANKVLPLKVYLLLLEKGEEMRSEIKEFRGSHVWTVFITYMVVIYVISLRGNESLLLDIRGLHNNWKHNDGSFFHVALLGKKKNKTNE